MKPRNKFERLATELSAKIPHITWAQEQYAYQHCFKHEALHRSKGSNEYFCLECGHVWQGDENSGGLVDTVVGVVCPHCHRKLRLSVSRRQTYRKDVQTYQIITTIEFFQVIRTFHVRQWTAPQKPAFYEIFEVSRVFQMEGRKPIILACPRVGMCCYNDIYRYNEPMSVKYDNPYADYRINATCKYPWQKVLPILKRNGYCKELADYNPSIVFERLLTSPKYETLAKAKRFDLWEHLEYGFVMQHWAQVKLMIRHDYHPSDYSIWTDTVEMAEELGLDTHSPKYILPTDLKRMHDILTKRIKEKHRREELERKKATIEEHAKEDKRFRNRLAGLLAMVIVDGDITITPLQGYEDYLTEGEIMHHCVETYWGKTQSFILKARGKNDEKLATIELDMKDFHIKQCRGVNNAKPVRYDEICGLLNAHRNDFLQAKKSRRKAS